MSQGTFQTVGQDLKRRDLEKVYLQRLEFQNINSQRDKSKSKKKKSKEKLGMSRPFMHQFDDNPKELHNNELLKFDTGKD